MIAAKSTFIFMQQTQSHSGTPDDGGSVPLASMPVGERGVIVDVRAGDAVGDRLLDLGLLPGTPVLVLRRAPLGDPCVYELRGYQLCLRRAEAERVRVRRTP